MFVCTLMTILFSKVRRVFAQVVIAMATHGYLELEGGQKLVEFIIQQCAISAEEEVSVLP